MSKPLIVSRFERVSRWLVLLSATLLAGTVGTNYWQARMQSRLSGTVHCDTPTHCFGEAFQGDSVRHTFHLTNGNNKTVTVKSVVMDCGCIRVGPNLTGRGIEPGESLDIPLTLRLDRDEGRIERKLAVVIDGDAPIPIPLKLTGTVLRRWEVTPEKVVFAEQGIDSMAVQTVIIRRRNKQSHDRIESLVGAAGVQAELEWDASSEQTGVYTIAVSAVAPIKAGRHEVIVYARPSNPAHRLEPIPIVTHGPEPNDMSKP